MSGHWTHVDAAPVRFDKEEAVVMDWHVDASIPLGEYSVQDRASNLPSRRLKLHKAPTG